MTTESRLSLRESRWIGGIIMAGIVVTVISIIVQPLI